MVTEGNACGAIPWIIASIKKTHVIARSEATWQSRGFSETPKETHVIARSEATWQSRRFSERYDTMETFYVYLLTNRNNRVLYTGVTNNLIRRVYEHRNHLDKGSFTDRYNIEKLVYFEETSSSRAAIEREKQIKDWSRAKKNALVNGTNPNWEDLWERIQ